MHARPYQLEAIQAVRDALNKHIPAPLVCLPTGSGKSFVIVTQARILAAKGHHLTVLCHTQEIIEQLAKTWETLSGTKSSVYSASLKRKEIGQVTFAQIQSAARKPELFTRSRLLLIDECERSDTESEGQYAKFIGMIRQVQKDLRICGFTATPYRMGTGLVYGDGRLFSDLVYDANVRTLIEDGYLCRLSSKGGIAPDLSGIHIRNGDYVADELELAMSDAETVKGGVKEILRWGKERHSWLVFCSGVKHAAAVEAAIRAHGVQATTITGDTPDGLRASAIRDFRNMHLRCLININVLSVGFDAPNVDLVAMLRPTKSPGLYYQQMGRGLRLHESKTDTLVLDLAGNIEEHGPIDTLNERVQVARSAKMKGDVPVKMCPTCSEMVHAAVRICPSCKYEFPRVIANHDTVASGRSVLSGEREVVPISRASYRVHASRNGGPPTLGVQYYKKTDAMVAPLLAQEFISLDVSASPYARKRGLEWLKQTPCSDPKLVVDGSVITYDNKILTTVLDLIPYVKSFASPVAIAVVRRPGCKYLEVVAREFA